MRRRWTQIRHLWPAGLLALAAALPLPGQAQVTYAVPPGRPIPLAPPPMPVPANPGGTAGGTSLGGSYQGNAAPGSAPQGSFGPGAATPLAPPAPPAGSAPVQPRQTQAGTSAQPGGNAAAAQPGGNAAASPGPGPTQRSPATPAPTRTASRTLGPSFDCRRASDPLGRLICSDPHLSELDLRYLQAYQALRYQLDESGRAALRDEALATQRDTYARCPSLYAWSSSSATRDDALACVYQTYNEQRGAWLARMRPDARREAERDPAEAAKLQEKLRDAGMAPAEEHMDGAFGPGTRNAIIAFQARKGRAVTGFLAPDDVQALQTESPAEIAQDTTQAPGQPDPNAPADASGQPDPNAPAGAPTADGQAPGSAPAQPGAPAGTEAQPTAPPLDAAAPPSQSAVPPEARATAPTSILPTGPVAATPRPPPAQAGSIWTLLLPLSAAAFVAVALLGLTRRAVVLTGLGDLAWTVAPAIVLALAFAVGAAAGPVDSAERARVLYVGDLVAGLPLAAALIWTIRSNGFGFGPLVWLLKILASPLLLVLGLASLASPGLRDWVFGRLMGAYGAGAGSYVDDAPNPPPRTPPPRTMRAPPQFTRNR